MDHLVAVEISNSNQNLAENYGDYLLLKTSSLKLDQILERSSIAELQNNPNLIVFEVGVIVSDYIRAVAGGEDLELPEANLELLLGLDWDDFYCPEFSTGFLNCLEDVSERASAKALDYLQLILWVDPRSELSLDSLKHYIRGFIMNLILFLLISNQLLFRPKESNEAFL